MQLVHTQTLGPNAADVWAPMDGWLAGPGTFVFFATCPVGDTETFQAQVMVAADSAVIYAVMEDATNTADDLAVDGLQVGFQSAPVPLLDASWEVSVRLRHNSASSHPIELRVVKL